MLWMRRVHRILGHPEAPLRRFGCLHFLTIGGEIATVSLPAPLFLIHQPRCSLEHAAPRTSPALLDYMDRIRVPAHELPSNGSAPFRTADRLCASHFRFAGAPRHARAASFASDTSRRLLPRRLPNCCSDRHATRASSPQARLASATGLRSPRAWLLDVHQSVDCSCLVSVHVPLLRCGHPLGI